MANETVYVARRSRSKPKVWPFYLVCDVSSSMWHESRAQMGITPFTTVQQSLPQIIRELQSDEQASDIAWLSIVAFADDPQQILPLSRLRTIDAISSLPQGRYTDYAAVFKYLAETVSNDIARLSTNHQLYIPTIFFLTDGHPNVGNAVQPLAEWKQPLEELKKGYEGTRPSIISLGFDEAGSKNLMEIATVEPSGAACIADPGIPSNELLKAILDNIVFSVTSSTSQGQLVFDTPSGMTRLQ